MKDEREPIKDDGFRPIYPGMLVTWMRPEFNLDRVTRYVYGSRIFRGAELREMRPGTTEGTSEMIMVVIGIDDIESMQSGPRVRCVVRLASLLHPTDLATHVERCTTMISSDVVIKPGMMITWTALAFPGAWSEVSHAGPTGSLVEPAQPNGGSSTLLVIAVDGAAPASCLSSRQRRVWTVLWNGLMLYIPQDWYAVMDVVT